VPEKSTPDIITIIIPVYKGRKETLTCIASVLEHTNQAQTPYELLIINDASPEEQLTEDLYALQKKHAFTLLENENNLGFIQTVNKGMNYAKMHDVVLLNSDTEVYSNWLTHLQNAAYNTPNVGTVTPFSNNAEIVSYPKISHDNPILPDIKPETLNQIIGEVNKGKTVEIPTAVGFCMYIKNDCLKETGLFDANTFGKGYGEENDFCLRATTKGWRHVLAADTFVFHKGGESFGKEKKILIAQNYALLTKRWPKYHNDIQDFVAEDPILPYRRSIDIARIHYKHKRHLLLVAPDIEGGTRKHVEDLLEMCKRDKLPALLLLYNKEGTIKIQHSLLDDLHSLCYKSNNDNDNNDIDSLISDLKKIGVWHIHYHHLMNLPQFLIQLAESFNISYDFTAHDYFTICPRINLINGLDNYCGEPDSRTCDACISSSGLHSFLAKDTVSQHGTVKQFKRYNERFLQCAQHVFVPSNDAAMRLQEHLHLDNITVRPHVFSGKLKQNYARPIDQRHTPYRIAIIGAIGPHKGSAILEACAQYAAKHNLPLEFLVIGFTDRDDTLKNIGNVRISGKYEEGELWPILQAAQCDIAFLPSPWPETWCYTLSTAFEAGLFPVCFSLGAQKERIRQQRCGLTLALTDNPKKITNTLLEAAKTQQVTSSLIPQKYDKIKTAYYSLD